MLLIRDIAMPLNFTGSQRRNESFATAQYPQTRMGMAAQMRQAFTDAQGYAAKWDEYNKKKAAAKAGEAPPSPPARDLKLEALLPYLEGKKPVIVKAEEPSDVETAYALAQEFKLRVILNGLTQSQAIYDKIAAVEAAGDCGLDLRRPERMGALRRGVQDAGRIVEAWGEDRVRLVRCAPGAQPALRRGIRGGVRAAL